MGVFQPVFFCVFVNVLVGAVCYGGNSLFDLIPAEFKVQGAIAMVVAAEILIFLVISFLPGVSQRNNWTFKLVVFGFLMTSFDTVTITDIFLENRNQSCLLTHFLTSGDPFMENVWAESLTFFNATLPHLLHFFIFYRIFNGQSWRSLYLFNVTVWLYMVSLFVVPMLTPEAKELYREYQNVSWSFFPAVPIFVIGFIRALTLPKSTGSANKGGKGKTGEASGCCSGFLTSRLFKLLNSVLTLHSLLILGTQALVALDVKLDLASYSLTEYYARTNPMLEFETMPQLVPFGIINIYVYIATVVPISVIHLLGTLQSVPRAFLWDLAVIQTAILFAGQAYCFAPFLAANPRDFNVEPTDPLFWMVNLLPVVASLFNLLRLSPYHRNDQTTLKLKKK